MRSCTHRKSALESHKFPPLLETVFLNQFGAFQSFMNGKFHFGTISNTEWQWRGQKALTFIYLYFEIPVGFWNKSSWRNTPPPHPCFFFWKFFLTCIWSYLKLYSSFAAILWVKQYKLVAFLQLTLWHWKCMLSNLISKSCPEKYKLVCSHFLEMVNTAGRVSMPVLPALGR